MVRSQLIASLAASKTAQFVGAAVGAAQTELLNPRPGVTPEPFDLPGPAHDRN